MISWEIISLTREEIGRILAYKKNVVYIIFFIAFETMVPIFALQQMMQEYIYPSPTLFQLYTKLFAYAYALSLGIFIAYGVSMDNFISDKQRKSIETMLTTPLSLGKLLLTKTLAIFLLSYFSMIFAFILFLVISNLLLVGYFVYVPELSIWATLFAVYPLTCFSAIALMGIGLLIARRPTAVNFTAFTIAFLLMVLPSFFTIDFIMTSADSLTLIYAEITVLLTITALICKKLLLKKEKVTLSI